MTKHHSDSPSSHREGATIRIHHRVRANALDRYETWLRQIIEAAARFPGHQGVLMDKTPICPYQLKLLLLNVAEIGNMPCH